MHEASSANPRDLAVAEFRPHEELWPHGELGSSGTWPHQELGLPQQSFLRQSFLLNSAYIVWPLLCCLPPFLIIKDQLGPSHQHKFLEGVMGLPEVEAFLSHDRYEASLFLLLFR
jgi:hypothetical protein